MAKLVLDWAENERKPKPEGKKISIAHGQHMREPILPFVYFRCPELKRFDFVFLVELRNVESNTALGKIILQQHELEDRDITQTQIEALLDRPKSLLIFDGYDEYKKGTNSDIDGAISGRKGNSYVIVTSRPEYMDKVDKKTLDGEIQIKGLKPRDVAGCAERYLGDNRGSEELLHAAERSGIKDLLRIPIILLMLCILSRDRRSLPVPGSTSGVQDGHIC